MARGQTETSLLRGVFGVFCQAQQVHTQGSQVLDKEGLQLVQHPVSLFWERPDLFLCDPGLFSERF